jgi:transcriptional regulator with XRE-family HTH domain
MEKTQNLGNIIKQQRNRIGLTLKDLSFQSSVSISHLGRIENAQRYPSPKVLRKISKPLNLDENELFSLAGYLPSDEPKTPDLEQHKLMAELDILVDRVTADITHIKNIIRKLYKKS